MNITEIEYFELVYGRKPTNEEELIEEHEKTFRQLGGNY